MLTDEQIKQIEHSFKHGNSTVIVVDSKVYVADEVLKHRKEATVEFRGCCEVNETCFESNGEYFGETLPEEHTVIINDTYANNPYMYASLYYEDEIVSIR